jgi:transposase-like protein
MKKQQAPKRKRYVKLGESVKRKIVREYSGGTVTLRELSQKHDVSIATVSGFVKQASEKAAKNLEANAPKIQANSEKSESKELAEAKLQILALQTLIDVAERELGIDIRKKQAAKQPKK